MNAKPNTRQAEHHQDPVCGMNVSDSSQYHLLYTGHNYYFCSEKCLTRFKSEPAAYTQMALIPGKASADDTGNIDAGTVYTVLCIRTCVNKGREPARNAV